MKLDDDPATGSFLLSPSATEVAARLGLWTAAETFDFARIFSRGEPRHKYYCGRRQWRALSLFAPSLELAPEYSDLLRDAPYPFSVRADAPLSRHDLCRVMRDTYEGTRFELARQLLAAGPFGLTDRYDGEPSPCRPPPAAQPSAQPPSAPLADAADAAIGEAADASHAEASRSSALQGAFERPIGIYRMAYSYVGEPQPIATDDDATVAIDVSTPSTTPVPTRPSCFHFAPHCSQTAVYFPIACTMATVPAPLAAGSVRAIDREAAYWAFRIAKHTVRGLPWDRCLALMRSRQAAWEAKADRLLDAYSLAADGDDAAAREAASEAALHAFARDVVADWWALLDELLLRYGDGWEHEWEETTGKSKCAPLAYPAEWLEKGGFFARLLTS